MKRKISLSLLFFAFALLLSVPVHAEEGILDGGLTSSNDQPQLASPAIDIQKAPEKAYGTSDWIIYTAGACDALYRRVLGNYRADNCVSIYPEVGETSTDVGFPIHIPTGANIQYVRIWYYDDTTATNPSIGLWTIGNDGTMTSLLSLTPSNFSGGNTMQQFGPISHTVDNYYNNYAVNAILNRSGSLTERIYKVMIYYTLQISPAPGVATFNDVGTGHWAFQYIEALYSTGMISGCGGGNYCPSSNVTRAEMAAFLAKLLGLQWEY